MEKSSHPLLYNSIGDGYRRCRVADPRIASQIREAVGNASTVCNVGAGAGSYEPADLCVTAVEPSQCMIEQRDNSNRVVRAYAEQLPFADGEFDVTMAVLTVHHWVDALRGLAEMQRVSRRQVILTFDPCETARFWLVRDYLPEIAEHDRVRSLPIESYRAVLYACEVVPVKVPWDCVDGFLGAYWRRPEKYLEPAVRNAISSFALLAGDRAQVAMSRLKDDLASGAWNERNSGLLELNELDLGYRLIVADHGG